MGKWFSVDHLDVERLLSEWRWLCPHQMALVARNAFGDLFLRDKQGAVFWLDAAVGRLTKVARSEAAFRELAETTEKRVEWFDEPSVHASAERGLPLAMHRVFGAVSVRSKRFFEYALSCGPV